jgi:hypothetical protein
MQSSKFIAAAALSFLAAVGAHAETYEGVHPLVSANSRAAVRAEAVVGAHSGNPWDEGASSRVAALPASPADRSEIRRDAVATAHGLDIYSESYRHGVTTVRPGYVDRATVRADARAAARFPQDPY